MLTQKVVPELWLWGSGESSTEVLPYVPGTPSNVMDEHATAAEMLWRIRFRKLLGDAEPPHFSVLSGEQHTPENSSELDPVSALLSRLTFERPLLAAHLLDGNWIEHVELGFGHVVWHHTPPAGLPSSADGVLWLSGTPPSCMDHAPVAEGWHECAVDEVEYERATYRATDGSVDLVVTLRCAGGKRSLEHAMWRVSRAANILCPSAPVDACVRLVQQAPVALDCLRTTSLWSYVDGAKESTPCVAPLNMTIKGDLHLSFALICTEQIVRQATTFFDTSSATDVVVWRDATRADAMSTFAHNACIQWNMWPTDLGEKLSILLRAEYRALGKSDQTW